MENDHDYYEECIRLQNEVENLKYQLIQKTAELNNKLKQGYTITNKYTDFQDKVVFTSENNKYYLFEYDSEDGTFAKITEVKYV